MCVCVCARSIGLVHPAHDITFQRFYSPEQYSLALLSSVSANCIICQVSSWYTALRQQPIYTQRRFRWRRKPSYICCCCYSDWEIHGEKAVGNSMKVLHTSRRKEEKWMEWKVRKKKCRGTSSNSSEISKDIFMLVFRFHNVSLSVSLFLCALLQRTLSSNECDNRKFIC